MRVIQDYAKIFPSIKAIGEDWFLITAEANGVVNTMTASWGQVGYLWNKPVFTVFVRPQRFTYHLLAEAEYFSISFFDGMHKELGYLGRRSGRDEDKIKRAGLSLYYQNYVPMFSEAKTTLVLKKLYLDPLKKGSFVDSTIPNNSYPNDDFSVMFIGEIVKAYQL